MVGVGWWAVDGGGGVERHFSVFSFGPKFGLKTGVLAQAEQLKIRGVSDKNIIITLTYVKLYPI